MATYNELAAIQTDPSFPSFSEKVRVAVIVHADAIRQNGAATDLQKAWAVRAIKDPVRTMESIRAMIVAANKTATIAQIVGATDAAIQTNVDAAADFFAANGG